MSRPLEAGKAEEASDRSPLNTPCHQQLSRLTSNASLSCIGMFGNELAHFLEHVTSQLMNYMPGCFLFRAYLFKLLIAASLSFSGEMNH